MSVSPSFQGKPADLKAEIAGLHMLLDPRLVALHAQSIPTFGEKKGLIFHLQLLFILGLEGSPSCHLHAEEDKVKISTENHDDHLHAKEDEDQVQLNSERQGGHLDAKEGEEKV